MRQSLIILFAFLVIGCLKPSEFPNTPAISFKSSNHSFINECIGLTSCDTVKLTVEFKDGDGDIGIPKGDTMMNIFLIDKRDGYVTRYQMPDIKPKGNIKSVSGEFDILILGKQCRNMLPKLLQDTITYKIQIKDKAGNISNTIDVPPIIIKCK